MPSDTLINAILEASAALQRAATLAADSKRTRIGYLLRCANQWVLEAVKKAVERPIEVREDEVVS